MKKSIILNNQLIFYQLEKSRKARRMRLAVFYNGGLVMTMPESMPKNLAEKFIRQKARWILSRLDYFKKIGGRPYLLRGSRRDYLMKKKAALKLVKEKIAYFNQFYNLKIGRIAIKNQKTRWGSASRKGNLNFNYKIVLMPDELSNYIIVHELCHLAEFNHSKRFWSLVAKTVPDYKSREKEIKI